MMASVDASSRASSFVASAETAAVRMAVMAEAFMMASGSPVSPLCRITAPRWVSRPRAGLPGKRQISFSPQAGRAPPR